MKNSVNQLRGNISGLIKSLREKILRDMAFIEAALDDPEHISLEGFSGDLSDHVEDEIKEIERLLLESKNGKLIREGIQTVILGKPNAGKSSLLNQMVGQERAIVTEIAGTTRDTVEETVNLGGITLNIIDTAGIRDTGDVIEKIGVEKAIRYAADADLILVLMDSSVPIDENDETILRMIKDKKAVILLNKSDLEPVISAEDVKTRSNQPIISFSVKEGIGRQELEQRIKDMFFSGELSMNDEIYITRERHREAFSDTLESLKQVKKSIDTGMPEDFYSIDLMNAYETLGTIIGENVGEDLIDMIFKEFCMGK